MAIKSFHPHKHLEHELRSQRFEELVADAWDEVHDASEPASEPSTLRDSPSATHVSASYHPDPPSNQPFAELGRHLKH